MTDFQGKVVAITGGASGLGAATARAFAERGARLALCDINGENLSAIKEELEGRGTRVYTEIVDVAQAWQVKEFSENVTREMGRTDVLVNNAGVACAGFMEDMSLDDWNWIMGVNLWGVIHGTHFFYPLMLQEGGGHIVNVASCAGLAPLPMISAYCGTKSAVVAMTRVWRAEAAARGVAFTVVCPGFMTTNISKTARMCSNTDRKSSGEFGAWVDRFFVRGEYDPGKVARALIRGVEKNKSVVSPMFAARFVDITNRLSRRLTDLALRIGTEVTKRWL